MAKESPAETSSEPTAPAAARSSAASAEKPASETSARRAAPQAAPAAIVRVHTRVFTPPAEVLEANRILHPGSADPAASAFRMLRTQVLQRMDARGFRSIGIFSPGARDGKTTTAINLALSLANDKHHTALLVDFDFNRPTVAACLGLAPEFGVDDLLTGKAQIEDCLYHPAGFERFVVLPARGALAHSSEIVAGPASRKLVAELHDRYPERIVVYDLPPVLTADDALAFAPLVDCGLVVAAEGRTRRNDLLRTIELLANTALVGTVLNRAAETVTGY